MKTELEYIIAKAEKSIEVNQGIIRKANVLLATSQGPPVTDISITWKKEKLFQVTWLCKVPGIPLDLEFRDPAKKKRGEWFSVRKLNKDAEILSSNESHLVGLGSSDTDQEEWEVRLKTEDGNWVSDIIPIAPRIKENDTDERPELSCKLHGFWVSSKMPKDAPQNVYKGYLNELDEFPDHAKLIPIISGFRPQGEDESLEAWKKVVRERISDREKIIDRYRDRIAFIILQDEPYYKGFSREMLEIIIDIAKEIWGNDLKLGYSFADANVDQAPPRNIDVLPVNMYLFFDKERSERYIDTKEEFLEEANKVLDYIRNNGVQEEIVIIAQGFYSPDGQKNRKYRRPSVESPFWHFDLLREPDVIGIVYYIERDRGILEMPEMYENIGKAFRQMCPG